MKFRIRFERPPGLLDDLSATTAPEPEPEHAWRALSLVNEWIRHSDAKAGVTLAFVAALGAMLFNLVKESAAGGCILLVLVALSCCLLGVTVVLCALTLTPRVGDRDVVPEAINRLFFGSITKHFRGDRPGYTEVLSTLTSDPRELVKDIAHQIHANARIATVKGEFAKWAIRSAMISGAGVAAVALVVGIESV